MRLNRDHSLSIVDLEAFHQYILYDPRCKEYKTTGTMTFINQASKDIRKKLQRLEKKNKPLRYLVQFAKTGRQRRKKSREREKISIEGFSTLC